MKVEATSLEAVHTHTHTTHLVNKNKISNKSIKDSNSLNKF